MGLEKIKSNINSLIEYWKKQNIEINTKPNESVISLPNDFIELYSKVNGMEILYPNEMDNEGFLFYPIQGVISTKIEFKKHYLGTLDNVFIFADYMHKSWWYGVKVEDMNNYIIGIIPDGETFKPITKSLSNFIELYLNDSSELYDYE